ncbi:diguanylate cyclase [Cyanobacterium aponinum AL20118]|uniref:Diguanylate cyclase n=1 Tax=Cyanobacterium aponinum AL20115 TaxID=3090662 RepID=A0AAF1C643_9CHRO|nr:diguanylate cyclase [Cyanobacterium aponinum]WPF88194.1 diguanylate cyclase [Cyanobacterium aponinum AL20115]
MKKTILLNLIGTMIYVIALKLSSEFISLSGNVASVWFPSAITLSMVFYYGERFLPTIIIGSLIIFIPALYEIDNSISLINNIFFCLMVITGDILQPYWARNFIKKNTHHRQIFAHLSSILIFIVAAVVSPSISAIFGVTALWLIHLITIDEYWLSFYTWWLASSLIHLLFSPPFMIYCEGCSFKQKTSFIEFSFVFTLSCSITYVVFRIGYPLEYLFIPILLWSIFRLSNLGSSLLVSLIALVAIVATENGYGIFVTDSANESLILLQSFCGILSLTTLILSAVVSERRMTEKSLQDALESLELKVLERTKQLTQAQIRLKHANYTLEKMANTDSLTQVANRRYFDRTLEKEWNKAIETQQSLSLLLIDIDCFKQYNDTYGHQQGDECLIQVAQTFKTVVRHDYDCVARYGGEEFAVILPQTTLQEAKIVAVKIIKAVRQLQIEHRTSIASDIVTLSIGISVSIPQANDSLEDFIQKADKALYQAKQQGRDRFVILV